VGELLPARRHFELPGKLRLRRVCRFQEWATILCLQSRDFDDIFGTFRRLTTSLLRSRLAILHRTQKDLPILVGLNDSYILRADGALKRGHPWVRQGFNWPLGAGAKGLRGCNCWVDFGDTK
jgi:hypothetical protein